LASTFQIIKSLSSQGVLRGRNKNKSEIFRSEKEVK